MPCCVLRVIGEAFEPGRVLASLSLLPYSVFRKGDVRFVSTGERFDVGGFNCEVSTADGDLTRQAADAIEFLERHHDDIRQLIGLKEIESKYLDFGYDCRLDGERCCLQRDFLPSELLKHCGDLGVGIALSLYPTLIPES